MKTGDLEARVQRIIDANLYMVLGTADGSGRPWTSPVFFAADGYHHFLWVSSPDVTHSRNLAVRPELSIVIFDSQAPVGAGADGAVYMTGTAAEVPEAELDRALAGAPDFAERGGREFTLDDLRPPAPYRLYRATVTEHSVLCPRPAGRPCADHGLAHDHRTEVAVTAAPRRR